MTLRVASMTWGFVAKGLLLFGFGWGDCAYTFDFDLDRVTHRPLQCRCYRPGGDGRAPGDTSLLHLVLPLALLRDRPLLGLVVPQRLGDAEGVFLGDFRL